MRILFTCAGGSGHAEPLVPFARAAEAAGHIVAFAGDPTVAASLQARGLTVFGKASSTGTTPPRITPLLELSREWEDRVLRNHYADRLARARAVSILALGAERQPDLIVRCEALGVRRALDAVRATPESVGEAVSRVLADPSYRWAAERMRVEIDSVLGPEYAATVLEQLATDKRPLHAASIELFKAYAYRSSDAGLPTPPKT